jgi:hypothetical protein
VAGKNRDCSIPPDISALIGSVDHKNRSAAGRHPGYGDIIVRFKGDDLKRNRQNRKREFIGVTFKCCKVYTRIYLKKKNTAFLGWCPKCGAPMEVLISPTGSKSRFFQTT